MPTWVKNKIPWLKIALALMVVVLIIVVVGFAIPGAGAAMIGGFIGFWIGVGNFFFMAPTWYSTVILVAIAVSIVVAIAYRKYFFRQKISSSSAMQTAAPQLQSGLINTSPLQATPVPQQIVSSAPIVDSKTEVTTSA